MSTTENPSSNQSAEDFTKTWRYKVGFLMIVVGNLTIASPRESGYATVYPCASGRPETSNINYRAGQTIANTVIVEPDADGMVCVFTNKPAEVIFDLLGTTGTGFTGVTPGRPLDTRTR